jgi:hypothetical protein
MYDHSYYYSRSAKDGIKQAVTELSWKGILPTSFCLVFTMAMFKAFPFFGNAKFNFLYLFYSFCSAVLLSIGSLILIAWYQVKTLRAVSEGEIAISISKSGEVKILDRKELSSWTDNLWADLDVDKDREIVCWPASYRFCLTCSLQNYIRSLFEINLLLSRPQDIEGTKKMVEVMRKEELPYYWEDFITAKIARELSKHFPELCQITDYGTNNEPEDFAKLNKAAEEIIKPLLDGYGIKIVN